VRVHLGSELLIPQAGQTIDFEKKSDIRYDKHDLLNGDYLFKPGDFILATTVEQIKTGSELMPFLDGRSTLARLGMTIYNTALLLDGPSNEWNKPVLEVKNHGNFDIRLTFRMPIGMISFIRVSAPIIKGEIKSRYSLPGSIMPLL